MSGLMLSMCAVLLAVPAPPEPTDVDRLQGAWRVVDADCDVPGEAKYWTGATVTVRGDRIQWRPRWDEPGESTFVLNPSKDPKEIDFFFQRVEDPTVPRKGIYALEKARLRLFWRTLPTMPRPTAFERHREREWEWLILERVPQK